MTDDLQRLVERIENATRPDREIDKAIMIALMPNTPKAKRQIAGIEFLPPPAPYTASLDTALTLVPDFLMDDWSLIGGHRFQAEVGHELADAATPALALCAAALRARITERTNNE